MRYDLSGTWHSRYEYGEDQVGEHDVELHQEGNNVNGHSLPHSTGSELELKLRLDRDKSVLSGFWKEKTSPTGAYRGQVFHGVLQLTIDAEATRANGKWAGHNRDYSDINTGNWTLERAYENTKI